jgi:hypothetical protein
MFLVRTADQDVASLSLMNFGSPDLRGGYARPAGRVAYWPLLQCALAQDVRYLAVLLHPRREVRLQDRDPLLFRLK